jgi:hypothetical protein
MIDLLKDRGYRCLSTGFGLIAVRQRLAHVGFRVPYETPSTSRQHCAPLTAKLSSDVPSASPITITLLVGDTWQHVATMHA